MQKAPCPGLTTGKNALSHGVRVAVPRRPMVAANAGRRAATARKPRKWSAADMAGSDDEEAQAAYAPRSIAASPRATSERRSASAGPGRRSAIWATMSDDEDDDEPAGSNFVSERRSVSAGRGRRSKIWATMASDDDDDAYETPGVADYGMPPARRSSSSAGQGGRGKKWALMSIDEDDE